MTRGPVISPTIAERYNAGASTSQLAAEERCSIGAINRRLRAMGVEIRPCGGQRRHDYDAILSARREGASYREIGKRFGLHFSGVARIVYEYGDVF